MGSAFTYISGSSAIHRADARVKVALLFVYSIAIFFAVSWPAMIVFMVLPLICAVVARLPWRALVMPLSPVIVLAAFAVAFGFWNDPTPNGLSAALLVGARMIFLVLASFIVCMTTTSSELLEAFAFFIGPLRHVHVPVDSICFTLTLALRFIPAIAEEFTMIRRAQQSRGGDLQGLSLSRKFQVLSSAVASLFIGLFRHAESLSDAMDARCYGLRK